MAKVMIDVRDDAILEYSEWRWSFRLSTQGARILVNVQGALLGYPRMESGGLDRNKPYYMMIFWSLTD